MSQQDARGDRGEASNADERELATRAAVLEAENERLREEYVRARRTQYRRTALALLAVGLLATAGGVAFPSNRTLLFALGGTGLFAGVLTYYLAPERFIGASVGEGIYAAFAENEAAIATELGLTDARIYVPTGTGVRLFVPQHVEFEIPDDEDLERVFVADDDERGVSLLPAGGGLVDEFDRALQGEPSTDPTVLAEQLSDALVEQFELTRRATADVDPEDGRATVGVAGSAYADLERFDHPVPSFLAVGLASGLDRPVSVEVVPADDERSEYIVQCTWEP